VGRFGFSLRNFLIIEAGPPRDTVWGSEVYGKPGFFSISTVDVLDW
jgi:hypothetical protein